LIKSDLSKVSLTAVEQLLITFYVVNEKSDLLNACLHNEVPVFLVCSNKLAWLMRNVHYFQQWLYVLASVYWWVCWFICSQDYWKVY